jgi:hypothetical protein
MKKKLTPSRTDKAGPGLAKRKLTKADIRFLRRLKPVKAVDVVERMEGFFEPCPPPRKPRRK